MNAMAKAGALAPMRSHSIYRPPARKLRGYNRGRLVIPSRSLPRKEQTIEIFKWDRLSSSLESNTSFDPKKTTRCSSSRRDTTDVAKDISRQTGFETNSQGKSASRSVW